MAKPQYDQVKEQVEKLTAIWKDRLCLSHYSIINIFVETKLDDQESVAETSASWCYLEAKVTWSLPVLVTMSKEGIENTVVHEAVHVLLDSEQCEVPEKYTKQKELATEMVTRALLRAWPQSI